MNPTDLGGLNFGEYAIAAFVIIGFINGLQYAFNKQWQSFIYFMIAVVAGSYFGIFHLFGLPNVEVGIAFGISTSGVYKGLQILGVKANPPAPVVTPPPPVTSTTTINNQL